MARIVKCGLIQAKCDWLPPKYSLSQIKAKMIDKHVAMIEQAAKKGVQMLSLQEIFYGPYFCAEQDAKWYDSAEPITGPTTKLMQELAKKHQMVIVSPIYETPSTGTYYNTAAVIDAD
ncbi:MAG: acyltransferase, partial [Elusimicrobia bacterium]|nr:acyltransferase [Elusimicrobiota bacterium]